MELKDYRRLCNKAEGKLEQLQQHQDELCVSRRHLNEELHSALEPAQALLQLVAQETQSTISMHIENIVQLALDAVFPDSGYVFKAKIETKRGKTEARLVLVENDREFNPTRSNGGGLADVLALALKISAFTLGNTRPIMILDEPMKYVSRDLQIQAAEIVEHLCKELELQFVVSTHIPEFVSIADKKFAITQTDGISEVDNAD